MTLSCAFVYFPQGVLGQVWYLILLYTCKERHLIQPLFLLKNTKSCITLLGWYFSVSPSSMFYPLNKHKTQYLTANPNPKITTHSIWLLAISLNYFFRIKEKELNTINAFFPPLLNMFTQCDVIKNLGRHYFLRCCNVASHGNVTVSIIYFVAFITEMEVLVLFLCRLWSRLRICTNGYFTPFFLI